MEQILKKYDNAEDDGFIGHDNLAREIVDSSKTLGEVEYDQEKQTKYYAAIRWAVNHLGSIYRDTKNYDAYFSLIREIKDIKNTNNTFLVKLTNRLIGKIKENTLLYQRIVDLCNEIIEFCNSTNNITMKTKIQTRLAEVHYLNEAHTIAIDIVSKTLIDLKRYEDNLGLIVLQLLESKIHYATKGISKAKASLTSVKTLCTKVYVEPKLQAKVDMHAGVLAAFEKDYNLAYSYFYESFDVFNIPNIKNNEKALKAMQYMILCKIMNGSLDDISNIIIGKKGQKFYGPPIKAFESIVEAVKLKSVKMLKDNILKNQEHFLHDDFIVHHLENLKNELIEKNLIKIIEPYSVVQIEYITNLIGLQLYEITMKISQMILDKKINGILDQGRGCLIIYDEISHNSYLEKTVGTFKNLDKVVESLMKKITAINPKPFLSELLNRQVIVRLKWGIEYHGKMTSFDKYMNFQLLDASEYIDGELKGSLGEILIRCNNVLFVRELLEEEYQS